MSKSIFQTNSFIEFSYEIANNTNSCILSIEDQSNKWEDSISSSKFLSTTKVEVQVYPPLIKNKSKIPTWYKSVSGQNSSLISH